MAYPTQRMEPREDQSVKSKTELNTILDRAERYVRTHLVECCREVLEFQDSGILCDDKVRKAATIYAKVNSRGALKMALDEVARQAMQRTAERSK